MDAPVGTSRRDVRTPSECKIPAGDTAGDASARRPYQNETDGSEAFLPCFQMSYCTMTR
jgi:hypothetical protein